MESTGKAKCPKCEIKPMAYFLKVRSIVAQSQRAYFIKAVPIGLQKKLRHTRGSWAAYNIVGRGKSVEVRGV